MTNDAPLEGLESEFKPLGPFMERNGRAYREGGRFVNKKLCLVATNKALLVGVLYELSERETCFYVKYSREPRDGMYLGRCFMTDVFAPGRAWRALKSHPRLMCSIQDDDFARLFRSESEVRLALEREAEAAARGR